MPIWETIKVYILGALLIGAVAAAWVIQDWRWQSKETNYVKEQLAQIQKEADKEAKAATKYEKKQEASNDTYKKIHGALNSHNGNPVLCFDPDRLRLVNSALTRKTPDTSGASSPMSRPDTAGNK